MHARTARPADAPARGRWWRDRRLRTTVLLAVAAVVLLLAAGVSPLTAVIAVAAYGAAKGIGQ